MGTIYEKLDEELTAFINAQKMFFVATAPLAAEGHVNVSPKGHDSFKIIDDETIAYLDLGGSGIETQAHVQENGRITIMFCAFDGSPNILRLYGQGEAIDFDHPDFAEMLAMFPNYNRARAVIRVSVTRIQDSCGWGVPFYEFKGERDQLIRYVDNAKSDEAWRERRYDSNTTSIDGLRGLTKPE